MNTTRRHPRTMREAFKLWPENCMGIEKPIVCCSPWWRRLWQWIKGKA